MIKRDIFSVVMVSIYILTYLVLLQYESALRISILMVLFFPVVLIWMIYTILKFGKYEGPGLGDNEFGYLDKNTSELGTF